MFTSSGGDPVRWAARQARPQGVLDGRAAFVALLTPDGTLRRANGTALETALGGPAELAGRAFADAPWWAHTPATRTRVADAIRRAAAGETVCDRLPMHAATGLVSIDAIFTPLLSAGRVVEIAVSGLETAERAKVQAAATVSQLDEGHAATRLRALTNSLPIALWTLDREQRVTHAAGRLLERIGFAPGSLEGRTVVDLLGDAPAVRELLQHVLDGEPQACTFERRGVWFESRHQPVRAADGTVSGAIGVAIDVTERVELEAQFRHAQRMEAIGRFAGGVAHDFNNLLTAIVGYAELAFEQLAADHPVRGDLQEIMQAGESASSLTAQLLAFTRRQMGDPQLLDLGQLVKQMAALLRRVIGEDVHLETIGVAALDAVRADQGQMEQVLMNLVVNARDAMPAGGTLTIETANRHVDAGTAARHPGATEGPYVAMTVRDTGIGMDATTLARVFEPFFTTKAVGEGTGLGLPTVYGIVTQSGGFLEVESEVGKGTSVVVVLPRAAVADAADAGRPSSSSSSSQASAGACTILLVEDQDAVRAAMRAVLERHGYTVIAAADGPEALERLAETPIDLLVTDLGLPTLNGREVARQVRATHPGTRVLFVSGYDRGGTSPTEQLGDESFMSKPFTADRLLRKVREALGP